ncbi:MAG TPA: helix-turn-helix transcriptional regulator [Phenylobacterium sp.]|nr:helix-turn-helix transcriptional regulator [Phenylobacterium sp.]
MVLDIDLHIGRRLRRRRRLLGMTQDQLASAIGVRFQQIQKYECAANALSASRLFDLARALDIDVQYFFDGFEAAQPQRSVVGERRSFGRLAEGRLGVGLRHTPHEAELQAAP